MSDTKVAPTKEQRIEAIDAQIAKLQQRKQDLIDGVVRSPAKKVVALPEVGAVIKFSYGRKTATTAPVTLEGTVLAVKPSVVTDGKTSPALIKVQYGEGFDTSTAVIYPAQIVTVIAA